MISPLIIYFEKHQNPVSPIDEKFSFNQFCHIDLSVLNADLNHVDITDSNICQEYVDKILLKSNSKVAFGGYLEKRNLYNDKSSFSSDTQVRDIHLGIDFWITAGTKVITPLTGKVHSFQNNSAIGDYGPTIILQHEFEGLHFHTLYGHLSLESIENIQIGQVFEKGSTLAFLGTPEINVNYAPHLHFQIIIDMEGKKGDYPGVCSADRLSFYTKNCPNPNILLQIPL